MADMRRDENRMTSDFLQRFAEDSKRLAVEWEAGFKAGWDSAVSSMLFDESVHEEVWRQLQDEYGVHTTPVTVKNAFGIAISRFAEKHQRVEYGTCERCGEPNGPNGPCTEEPDAQEGLTD